MRYERPAIERRVKVIGRVIRTESAFAPISGPFT
jgi:hypothetical protein